MTAKEMFESLGYIQVKNTKSIIEYIKKTTYNNAYDRVSFSLTLQSVNTTGKTGQNNPTMGSIYLPVLRAIMQQVTELGWL